MFIVVKLGTTFHFHSKFLIIKILVQSKERDVLRRRQIPNYVTFLLLISQFLGSSLHKLLRLFVSRCVDNTFAKYTKSNERNDGNYVKCMAGIHHRVIWAREKYVSLGNKMKEINKTHKKNVRENFLMCRNNNFISESFMYKLHR